MPLPRHWRATIIEVVVVIVVALPSADHEVHPPSVAEDCPCARTLRDDLALREPAGPLPPHPADSAVGPAYRPGRLRPLLSDHVRHMTLRLFVCRRGRGRGGGGGGGGGGPRR